MEPIRAGSNINGWAFSVSDPTTMEMNAAEITGWVLTAAVAVLGTIKLKLIEELVKKISPDESKAKGYSIVLLFGIVVALSLLTINSSGSQDDIKAEVPKSEIAETETPPPPAKTDLEMKVDVAKDVISTTKDIVKEIKENKARKDDDFRSSIGSHWIYSVGDWTDDETRVLELYNKLSGFENVRIFKHEKKYLFIKDDNMDKEELEAGVDSLRNLTGLNINVIDFNNFRDRKHDKLVERKEKFGRGREKKRLTYIEVE